jgi:hypothetical protein
MARFANFTNFTISQFATVAIANLSLYLCVISASLWFMLPSSPPIFTCIPAAAPYWRQRLLAAFPPHEVPVALLCLCYAGGSFPCRCHLFPCGSLFFSVKQRINLVPLPESILLVDI